MNADEAREQACHALAARLRAWGVSDGEVRARDYIAGLYSVGWRWQSPENRPAPPRREDECPTHAGQWAIRCAACVADELGTDGPTVIPAPEPKSKPRRWRDHIPRDARVAAEPQRAKEKS